MGKKSIISAKYLRKAEFLLIVALSFALYFFLKEEEPQKVESQEIHQAENEVDGEENEVPEIERNVSVYFDGEVEKIVKKMIKSAAKTIDAATYTYSKNEVTDLLGRRHSEGIKIRLAAGKNKDKTVPAYDFSLVKMKNGIYHPKFFVFDGRDVLILSANISSSPDASNNAVLFRNVPKAAAVLTSEINDVFEGKIGKRCWQGCVTEIGTIFFNPGKGCINIKNEFLNAKKSKKAVKSGIYTEMILDNWRGDEGKIVNKNAASYLESIGVKLKYDEPEKSDTHLFHHKFAEIDGATAVFGSMNWTASGCYRNREIVVIAKNAEVAASFEEYFDSF